LTTALVVLKRVAVLPMKTDRAVFFFTVANVVLVTVVRFHMK
jgi:hypothetical protein